MRLFSVMLGFCALLAQGPAFAEHPTDPLSWLGRISTAGQRLNYVGTFVYQSGGHVETSRIAHRVDAAGPAFLVHIGVGFRRDFVAAENLARGKAWSYPG